MTAAKRGLIKPGVLPQIALRLNAHVKAHLPDAKAGAVRLLWPDEVASKRRSKDRHHFTIKAGAGILATDCGALARRGFEGLREAGAVLMLESEEGDALFVEMEGGTGAPGPVRVSSGVIVADFERAVLRAYMHLPVGPERDGKGAEMRVLRVPAMHLSAVWSHHPTAPGKDRIVAYTENFGGLKSGRAYSVRRAEAILKHAAMQTILRWYERQDQEHGEKRRAYVQRGTLVKRA